MTKEDIIRMAREAGCLGPDTGGDPDGLWEPNGWENVTDLMFKFAALVTKHEREKVARWMMERGYATGHGDTIQDLIKEVEWQVAEREREGCASVAESYEPTCDTCLSGVANAIRAKGKK